MQLFKINSNLFQDTLTNEYDMFVKNMENNSSADEDTRNYVDGNILFSIPQQSGAFSRLISEEWNTTTLNNQRAASRFYDSEVYHKDVTDTIIKSTDSYSLLDAIQQVAEIVEAVGDNLAGILLVSGKTIINPLHPLTALILIDEMRNLRHDSFKIVTYLYKEKSFMHEYYRSKDADIERIKTNIMSLISLYSNKQQMNAIKEIIKVEPSGEVLSNVRQFYKQSVYEGNQYEGDFVVIPHQLLTKGIVAPYYGTSIILREDITAKGAFVSPFASANVSHKTTDEYTPEFASVCTGSSPKTTLDGLRTLVHANLSSPLNSSCMGVGAIMYADECIKQSINLYQLGGFINVQKETIDDAGTTEPDENQDEANQQEAELAEQDLEHEFNQTISLGEEVTYPAEEIGGIIEETRFVINTDFATTTDTTTFQTVAGTQIETDATATGTRFIHPDFEIPTEELEETEAERRTIAEEETADDFGEIPPIELEEDEELL